MPCYEYKCDNCGVIEIVHGMSEDNKTTCPECNAPLVKLISLGGGIIIAGREANQFNDIKVAKYWRDKNGDRHPVTASDGYSTSSTINRQTATPTEIKGKIQRDSEVEKQKRVNLTTARAALWNKEQIKKANSLGKGYVRYDVEEPP